MATDNLPPQKDLSVQENELQQTISEALAHADKQLSAGQTDNAIELCKAIFDLQPNHAEANNKLGNILLNLNQSTESLPYFRTALETAPDHPPFWENYVAALLEADQLDSARQVVELAQRQEIQTPQLDKMAAELFQPSDGQLQRSEMDETVEHQLQVRGPSKQDVKKLKTLQKKGRLSSIEKFAKDLIKRYPQHGLGYKVLGSMQHKQGKFDEAFNSLQKAVGLLPNDSDVHNDLGFLYYKKMQFAEAELHYTKALEHDSEHIAALCNLGNLQRTLGRFDQSEANLRKAIKLDSNAMLYSNLGSTLLDTRKIIDAEACYRKALKLTPNNHLAHINLGVCLRKQGRLEEAIKHQRRAVQLEVKNTEHRGNLLFTLNYSTDNGATFLNEAKKYGEIVTKKVSQKIRSWKAEPAPEKLRVGFVSGDLYNHPVGFFLESIIENFSSDLIKTYAYPTNPKDDDLTARLKNSFTEWVPLTKYDDEAAARKIHDDGIHILIDMSGHTSFNRLPMFAWRPAPIQASWLGYFATTGVTEIDFFLADRVGVPPEHCDNFTESLCYLPDTRLCFSEPKFDVPVSSLPALSKGHITFGCFQLLTKISDDLLQTWSEILTAIPESRIRWQSPQFDDPAVVEQFLNRLEQNGISSERVSVHGFMGRSRYLHAHSEVDLILDTFPFPGGTTTCEALWMGVPSLTLLGNSLLSRQGASLISAAGLQDWVATSKEDYIEKAISIANNPDKLSALRKGLREQVISSPLFDAKLFAKNFEKSMWTMWNTGKPSDDLLGKTVAKKTDKNEPSSDKPVMNFFNPVFWGTKNPDQFTNLMQEAAELTTAYHFGDNMFLFQRNNSMLNDQPFMDSWESNALTPPDRTIIWRRYILTMAGFHCQHLEGDFVECGAYQGVGAKTVIDYLGGPDFPKTFWLYDLFEHSKDMAHHAMQAHGPDLHKQVRRRFADYPNVKIFKGFLPEVLEEGCPEKIAYLHLDLNQAPAEIATLDALFDRVVPGGMIILDDYEMVFYRAQKLAEDSWFGKRGYKVFPLPTSQGFVIKR